MTADWVTISEELDCRIQAKGVLRRLIDKKDTVIFEWEEQIVNDVNNEK